MNPSLNYEVGLLIEGFDDPPTFMMTYNPPYYAELIESYGFVKAHDLFAYSGTRKTSITRSRGWRSWSIASAKCSTSKSGP